MTQRGIKIESSSELTGVSVVICTYNGKKVLKKTLGHLALQKTEIPFEVILIDNASTDGTKEFADQCWDEHAIENVAYRSACQPIPGKSYAQEMGFKMARYKYLLICDDDNWLSQDYLQSCFNILESDLKIGMLGGEGIPVSDIDFPDWFDGIKNLYAVGPQASTTGDITRIKGYVYGAGCVVRTEVWNKIIKSGVELLLTCRTGDKLVSGGDNEMGYLISAVGYKIFWDTNLKFQHFIPGKRLTYEYIKNMRIGFASTYEILKTYKYHVNLISKGIFKNSVIGDFLDSARIVSKLWVKYKIGRITKIQFILSYYFHGRRIVEILKNGAQYSSVHSAIKSNINLIRNGAIQQKIAGRK